MKAAGIGIAIALVMYLRPSIFKTATIMEISYLPLNDSPSSTGLAYEDVSFTSRVDSVVLKVSFCLLLTDPQESTTLML